MVILIVTLFLDGLKIDTKRTCSITLYFLVKKPFLTPSAIIFLFFILVEVWLEKGPSRTFV